MGTSQSKGRHKVDRRGQVFSKEFLEESKRLERRWRERYSDEYGDREFTATTASGIPIKPVYGPADIQDIDLGNIGFPGVYPYTRGTYSMQYQFRPWVNYVIHGYGIPESARERMDHLAKEGSQGFFGGSAHNLVFDLPTNLGYDPDYEEAEGRVGECGISVCTVEDMERLFHDMPLDRINVSMVISEATMVGLAMYIVAAEKMGFAKETLHGNTMNFLYWKWYVDTIGFPPQSSFKLMVELIKYCCREMPQWNSTNITASVISDTGGNAIQETGFGLATSIALTEACIKAGLQPDQFLPRFGFQVVFNNDFLECIAKLRAMRRMWAKINKERFNCQDQRSMQLRVNAVSSGAALTAQQPLNNIVRIAYQALAAVLAGGNSISTASYDEALAIPTEQAATLALRTQQIILHESRIPNVTDPLGGSYYMEWLTGKLEEEAYKLIDEVEERGGYLRCWEDGWLKNQILNSAAKWRADIESGKEIVVGLNKYVTEEKLKVELFKVGPEVERIARDRVNRHRKERDNTKTRAALARLKEEAEIVQGSETGREGYLMPAVIEAVRAGATLGETMDVLRDVFGWAYAW